MREDNFAEGIDIFTGAVDENCPSNQCFGEIHTGERWQTALERIVGTDGRYMPLGLVVFGDKSHTDLHGALSLTPVTFTASFFNQSTRNNPNCWRPMAYIPNLAYGKGGIGMAVDKVQDEHNCLAYGLKSFIELSEAGGIRTTVMGKEVIVKPFVHYFIRDTEGHNKWLGHYQGSKPGMARPYRDCHCTFENLNNPTSICVYTKASEFRRAMRKFDDVDKRDEGLAMLKKMSRHPISNALYQSKLPLSDNIHGANKMCPPETLHVLDAGITIYMMESLRLLLLGGISRDKLNERHVTMAYNIKRQSERDLPRGSIRNGIIDTTRCQSSERRGNLFLLLCIAHTADGSELLQQGLGYNNKRWKKWLKLLKLYLAMSEWFHSSRPKEEVRNARGAVSEIMKGIQIFFPRKTDSHGYNIPKMHALGKIIDYICEFGSAINFYSGPGEASHKSFVKAPGRKTQRRISEFASQTAGQYYNIMSIEKACKYVDTRLTHERISAEQTRTAYVNESQFTVAGKYTVDLYPNGSMRLRSKKGSELERHGLDETLVDALRNIANRRNGGDDSDGSDNNNSERFEGYTHASVTMGDNECVNFNAHPFFHGAPWYDWAYIHYVIEGEDGPREEYYPSRILGFVNDSDDNEITAIIQCSEDPVAWEDLEEKFFVNFKLCSTKGREEQVQLSSLVHPICVVPNYGEDDSYIMILPKGCWSKYFTAFITKKNET